MVVSGQSQDYVVATCVVALRNCLILAVCLGVAYGIVGLNIKVRQAAEARVSESRIAAAQNYSKAHLVCRKAWPLADPLKVHECALQVLD
ncbi:MAG TPA: hypothetical protein DCW74_12875 [Alteromonas australica]|uniref:Uncharacterized protein n=1 Tax=Alteromonas australica TaxID=589873 RepID=A0A350P5P7_9ALTE|nr:hypothetical protein [Alteromonas australica]|tara:strand:- start:1414 stop:1683 length:270 start_codon:yes stop_codon:yes gene_type:complete